MNSTGEMPWDNLFKDNEKYYKSPKRRTKFHCYEIMRCPLRDKMEIIMEDFQREGEK